MRPVRGLGPYCPREESSVTEQLDWGPSGFLYYSFLSWVSPQPPKEPMCAMGCGESGALS